MKTYEQFASEMTPEARAEAEALVKSVHEPWMDAPLELIDRSLPSDAEHFKEVPLTPEELEWLRKDAEQDAPWTCSKCEALNTDDKCLYCGTHR